MVIEPIVKDSGVIRSKEGTIVSVHCTYCLTREPLMLDYVVRPQVWLEAMLGIACGPVCLSCLQSLLGRNLTQEDFTESVVNVMIPQRFDLLFNRQTEEVLSGLRKEFGRLLNREFQVDIKKVTKYESNSGPAGKANHDSR
jgi:hypothetical protein